MARIGLQRVLVAALKSGFRHIDTAQIYQNETDVGLAIRESGVPRDGVFVTTKVWVSNYSPARFLASVDESLRRLQSDYIDLLLVHWPCGGPPLEAQIGGLNAAVQAGKARHIGVSNYNAALKTLDIAMSRIEQASKGKTRTISVGTTPWIAANVLPPAIRSFREHRPDLTIRLFDGDLDAVAKRVAAGRLDLGLGVFGRMPGIRGVPFFRFSLMVVRPDQNADFNRVSTKWSALSGQTLIFLTKNYPHQQLIDAQLVKSGVAFKRGQTVNLLDTQIGLVAAGEGIAIIPSFGLAACRSRSVSMSELVEPIVTQEFYEISDRGARLPEEASEFSAFLKKYIASWAGEAGIL
jgi:DNA-binding transcriptional LysR family regulator